MNSASVDTATSAATMPTQGRRLSGLDESQRYERFDRLQQRMRSVWDSMRHELENESVVVIPSISLDKAVAASGTLSQAMEERFLFLLLLLRQPHLRMIYVTSMPIMASIVEYYLALLPGVIPSHARGRLSLVSVHDATSRPLSEKLLARPRVLARIRDLIPDVDRCHLIPYNTTELERDIAVSLGVPMYGADPRLADLGSKTGCRRLFADVQVPHPAGVEDLRTTADIVAAIMTLRADKPAIAEVVVKLNEGVSGEGNALVDLRGIPDPGDPTESAAVRDRVEDMQLESDKTPLAVYLAKFLERGGIVEERISGRQLRSPSAQLRVTPDGVVELLSTHDQLLGGASGQKYLGCLFPADPAYSRSISEHALRIGHRLAALGVLGRFAVDFVVVLDSTSTWNAYAIEINLRKGGTTHPFLTLQFLTDGRFDSSTGEFFTPGGARKHLVATDHLESPALTALSIDDLFDIVARHGLHFDQSRQCGVVFHMISSLTEHGRLGMTAVGDTADDAWGTYKRATQVLLDEAQQALVEPELPGR